MSYKILLIAALLVWLGRTYTDITMLNCPAQFNITAFNITTSNTAARLGSFLYSAFQTSSSKARVLSIVTTGNTKDLSRYTS